MIQIITFMWCFATISWSNVVATKKQVTKKSPDYTAQAQQSTWTDIQKAAKDTVVQVFAYTTEFDFLRPYAPPAQSAGSGTAFFIEESGLLVTNYHVVRESICTQIQIPSFGLERFNVIIKGVCPDYDIALLQLEPAGCDIVRKKLGKIPCLVLGNSDELLKSVEVMTFGYPLGQTCLKSTIGILSGRHRFGALSYYQTDAAINPGNSGGPTVNKYGHVVGINTCVARDAQNIGYFIPINEIKIALDALRTTPLLRAPSVAGCSFHPAMPDLVSFLHNPSGGGCFIARAEEGSYAYNLGMREGDMLYQIDEYTIDAFGDINVPWSDDKICNIELLSRYPMGTKVPLLIYRNGQPMHFDLEISPGTALPIREVYPEFEPDMIDYEIIGGLVVMNITMNHIKLLVNTNFGLSRFFKYKHQTAPALIITHIFPGSLAHMSRVLSPGDVITQVNGQDVTSLEQFRGAILQSKNDGVITIKTDDKSFAVLALEKIVQSEPSLAHTYSFQMSSLIEQLKHLFYS